MLRASGSSSGGYRGMVLNSSMEYPLQRNSFFLRSATVDLRFLACLLASLGDRNTFFDFAILHTSVLPNPSAPGSSWSYVPHLLAGRGSAGHGLGAMDRLMVTSTMGVIHWIHGYPTDRRVKLSSGLGPLVSRTGLHDRLFCPAVSSQYTDRGPAFGGQVLQAPAWEPDSHLVTHSSIYEC